ncbi:hypothetical protein DFH08DRAFT_809890 [Mycena albidolilacea]|uniref:Uncharacterized protein n=1 Tax=Mycena albidolilacea TaxID=1033008 RepID=A0AAD6ZYU2_9AGAR|nr:hypothetical protein DFH08DRAFT_809890 [Mycena albidolilacea]
MPIQPTDTQVQLSMLTTCFAITVTTLKVLANSLQAAFMVAITHTTLSLLKNIEMEYWQLPPSALNHIGKFTETLHKIHTFVESQQSGSKVKQFFHQGEMSILLKDCKNGLTQGLDFFRQRHQEVLGIINALSDTTSSDRASTALVGWGGPVLQELFIMDKSLSTNKIELAALIGAHLGLKPGKDLTQVVLHYFTIGSSSLLVLDNLETVWEPIECCGDIEELRPLFERSSQTKQIELIDQRLAKCWQRGSGAAD